MSNILGNKKTSKWIKDRVKQVSIELEKVKEI